MLHAFWGMNKWKNTKQERYYDPIKFEETKKLYVDMLSIKMSDGSNSGNNNPMFGKDPWNKGLTKNTHPSLMIVSTKLKAPKTPEHKKKLSLAKTGKEPWNKGRKTGKPAWNRGMKMSVDRPDWIPPPRWNKGITGYKRGPYKKKDKPIVTPLEFID